MGFFDRLKNSLYQGQDDKTPKESRQNNILDKTFYLSNGQVLVTVTYIKMKTLNHNNGAKTDLYEVTAIHKEHEDDAYIFSSDQLKNILFEVPAGRSIDDESLINTIVRLYEQEINRKRPDSNISYVGYINGNENEDRIRVTAAGREYVEQMRKNEAVQKAKREYENSIRNAEYEERVKKEAELMRINGAIHQAEYEKEIKATQEDRKRHPYLEQTINGYDGVDMINGDVLRIRSLVKVGKDEEGTYLYTAKVSTTPNEHDVEFFDKSVGQAICFTTNKKIEDIINEKDSKQIGEFLKLLSYVEEQQEQMLYMGDFNRGKISEKQIDDLSNTLKQTIKKKQNEYRRKNNDDIDV